MAVDNNFIRENAVRKAARRIHEAGGCDAKDEYSRGYDDAVMLALNILLEETGYVVEDILDYGEVKEDKIYE